MYCLQYTLLIWSWLNTDNVVVVITRINNTGLLKSDNKDILQHSDVSLFDNNTVLNNTQGDSLPGSEDELISS